MIRDQFLLVSQVDQSFKSFAWTEIVTEFQLGAIVTWSLQTWSIDFSNSLNKGQLELDAKRNWIPNANLDFERIYFASISDE